MFMLWPMRNTTAKKMAPTTPPPSMAPSWLNTVEITLVASPRASSRE